MNIYTYAAHLHRATIDFSYIIYNIVHICCTRMYIYIRAYYTHIIRIRAGRGTFCWIYIYRMHVCVCVHLCIVYKRIRSHHTHTHTHTHTYTIAPVPRVPHERRLAQSVSPDASPCVYYTYYTFIRPYSLSYNILRIAPHRYHLFVFNRLHRFIIGTYADSIHPPFATPPPLLDPLAPLSRESLLRTFMLSSGGASRLPSIILQYNAHSSISISRRSRYHAVPTII
jgi:hypothetical protein